MNSAATPVEGGALRGLRLEEVDAYLGIPYAAPPAGELRWAPPVAPEPWQGERDATAPGPPPPQPERPLNRWFHGPLPATDEAGCLTLNVWAPRGGEGLPLLVWLHGGGWALGWGSAPIFDGAALAAALDAVVVTCNYRLGSLGWLHHPELGAPSGDWGILDQAAVLRWVRRNAAAFGADPGRVTLAGQSAGAASALHLLASAKLGEGLFSRLIALSPPLGEAVVPAAAGLEWAEALAERLGGGSLEALCEVPAAALVAAHEELLADPRFRGTRGGAMPIVLPGAIAADPHDAPAAQLGVEVMTGTTSDEATFLFRAAGRHLDPDEAQVRAIVGHQRGVEDAAATIAAYREREPGADPNAILCRIVTDKLFAEPVAAWAAARAAAGGTVYAYRQHHRSPQPGLGATHSVDVPLLFGSFRSVANAAEVAGDDEVTESAAAELQRAVRAFVHGEPPWPAEETRQLGLP